MIFCGSDELTDVSGTAQILNFIGGIDKKYVVREELPEIVEIMARLLGKKILRVLWSPVTKRIFDGKTWNILKLEAITSVTKSQKLLRVEEKDGGSKLSVLYCIIYQQFLYVKCLGMTEVVKPVISEVNFIRPSELNRR